MAIDQEYKERRVNDLPTSGLSAGDKYALNVGGGKYQTYIVSDTLQLVKEAGADFIEKDTMAEMRALSAREIWALQNGYYKGVKLNGYYEKADTPAPIIYYLSDTTAEDDGGSVIDVGGIKLEHKFIDVVYPEYFGAKGDGTDESLIIKKVVDYVCDNNLIFKSTEGTTYIIDNVIIEGKSNFKIDSKCLFKRQDDLPSTGTTAASATSTIRFNNCTDFDILNLRLDGNALNNSCDPDAEIYNSNNLFQESRHNLYISNCHRLNIYSIISNNPSGDGMYVTNGSSDIYIQDIRGYSVDSIDNIVAVGRNLFSIVSGINITVGNIYSDGIGHKTMPSGFDIEPNNVQSVDNVYVDRLYVRSEGMSALGLTTKYGGGNSIRNVTLNSVYLENKSARANRLIVVTGASNSTINTAHLVGHKDAFGIHVGLAGESQPVYDLNIKQCLIEYTRYGFTADNLTGGNINLDVRNNYENFLRLYSISGVNFNVTGNFAEDIDESTTKNFVIYLNTGPTKNINNVNFSGDISKDKVGKGQRAITSNNSTKEQITNTSLENLNLDGWSIGNKIVGTNLRISQNRVSNLLNRGLTTDYPSSANIGHRFFNEDVRRNFLWDNSLWLPELTGHYVNNPSASASLPLLGGIINWENNHSSANCTLTVNSSTRYHIGTVYILRNNQNRNVSVVSGADVTIQGSTSFNSVVMESVGDCVLMICIGSNTWRLTTISRNATPTTKGLVNQSVNVTDITTADATDLSTALVLVNELKSKLNAKLSADRTSGQQAT